MRSTAQREEHPEQAFLAVLKFGRADRFPPHGCCLLPPTQQCDKGNACSTCSVFLTNASCLETLQRQFNETGALTERTAGQVTQRHGKPMPDDNVWLAQCSG